MSDRSVHLLDRDTTRLGLPNSFFLRRSGRKHRLRDIGYTARMSAPIQFETANYRWTIALKRKEHRTTASVVGLHKEPQAMPDGSSISKGALQRFTVEEANQDDLFDRIRALIVEQDGPITSGAPDDQN